MEQKIIEGKIKTLQENIKTHEIALNEINDCEELVPAYQDIIKAQREHLSDLSEILSTFFPKNNVCCAYCKKPLDPDEIETNKRVKYKKLTCRQCYYDMSES
jgi:hypothetical protein